MGRKPLTAAENKVPWEFWMLRLMRFFVFAACIGKVQAVGIAAEFSPGKVDKEGSAGDRKVTFKIQVLPSSQDCKRPCWM